MDGVTRHVPSRAMEQIEQHRTVRVVSFLEPALADLIAEIARQQERSVSAEVRRALRSQYLEGGRSK